MNNTAKLSTLTLALACAFAPAARAQSNEELLKELRALKDRVAELEKKLNAKTAAQTPAGKPAGMTPEQTSDFNRIAVKTEALEDAMESQGLKALKISGYMDPTYIYNQRERRSGFQFLNRVSDDGYNYDNGYFGLLSLDFMKELEGGTKWHLTLMPNRGAGSIADPAGNSIVHEASVSIPLTNLQTRFIAGQIPDWSGYEYIQPTLTKLVTRGLLLDFTEPTVYTGAGMDYVRGKWEVKGILANYGVTKNAAQQRAPAFAYRVDYSKGEFNGFGFAGVHGLTANPTAVIADAGTSRLDLFEFDGYFIRGDLTAQGQIGFGRQRGASIIPAADGSLRDARWWGVSALAAYKFIPRWEGVVRADYINNRRNGGGLLGYAVGDSRNGIGPDGNLGCGQDPTLNAPECDIGANRYAVAFGVNYLLTLNTTLKAEYRFDGANLPVFLDLRTGTYRKSNQLFGMSLVVSF
jgi:opacity protein-like surface antigen